MKKFWLILAMLVMWLGCGFERPAFAALTLIYRYDDSFQTPEWYDPTYISGQVTGAGWSGNGTSSCIVDLEGVSTHSEIEILWVVDAFNYYGTVNDDTYKAQETNSGIYVSWVHPGGPETFLSWNTYSSPANFLTANHDGEQIFFRLQGQSDVESLDAHTVRCVYIYADVEGDR